MTNWQMPPLQTLSLETISGLKELVRIGDGSIRDVAYSPDGRLVAAGSSIGVWIYDRETKFQRLLGKDECGYRIAFSPDGTLIASTGNQYEVFVWQLADDQLWTTYKVDQHLGLMRPLEFHPTRPLLAVGGWDHQVHFFNLMEKRLEQILPYPEPVNSIAFHPEGRLIAVGGFEGNTSLYNLETLLETKLPRLKEIRDAVEVAFSPSGLLAYGCGGSVALWDVIQDREQHRFSFGAQSFQDITFNHSGMKLATAHWAGAKSGPGHIRIFDLGTFVEQIVASDGGVSVAFSPDDKVLAFAKGGWNSTIEFYELDTEQRLYMPNHGNIATGLTVSSDSKLLAHGASRGRIRVITMDSGELIAELQKKNYDFRSALEGPFAFYPDDQSIVFDKDHLGLTYLRWSFASGELTETSISEDVLLDALVSTTGSYVVVGYWGHLHLMQIRHQLETLQPEKPVMFFDVAVTTDKKVLVVKHILQQPVDLNEPPPLAFQNVENLDTHVRRQGWSAKHVSVSKQQKFIAVGGGVGSELSGGLPVGFVWDITQDSPRLAFALDNSYGSRIDYALLSPDDRLAIFATNSGRLSVWDIEAATCVLDRKAHPSSLWGFRLTPDGKRLVSTGGDGTIRIWGVPAND